MKSDLKDLFVGFMIAVAFIVMAIGIVHAEDYDEPRFEPAIDLHMTPDDQPVLYEDDAVDC